METATRRSHSHAATSRAFAASEARDGGKGRECTVVPGESRETRRFDAESFEPLPSCLMARVSLLSCCAQGPSAKHVPRTDRLQSRFLHRTAADSRRAQAQQWESEHRRKKIGDGDGPRSRGAPNESLATTVPPPDFSFFFLEPAVVCEAHAARRCISRGTSGEGGWEVPPLLPSMPLTGLCGAPFAPF
jgi:hypothetical protein